MATKNEEMEKNDKEALDNKLDGWRQESQGYRKQFEKKWKEQERFYNGKHWKYAKNRPVKNFCFSTIEAEVPILTDSRPESSIIAKDEEKFDDAKMLETAVQYVYDEEDLQLKLGGTVRNFLKTGNDYIYVDYDPEGDHGEGAIELIPTGWRHVFLDPTATDINKARYTIIRFPMRVDEVKRKYPEKADEIQSVSFDPDTLGDSIESFIDPEKWDGTGGFMDDDVDVESRYKVKGLTVVDEYWFKDYSMIKIPEDETTAEILEETTQLMLGENPDIFIHEDHDAHMQAHEELKAQIPPEHPNRELIITIIDDHNQVHNLYKGQNPKGEKPKYPNNIRLVVKNGDVVLYDGPNPIPTLETVPLVPFYCYKDNDSIYATGELKNIIDAQKTFNEMDYKEYKGLRLVANPGFVIDEESGVVPDTLTDEDGLVIVKKQGTEARRLEAGTVNPQLAGRKLSDQSAMEQISGINEATQGRRPTGITAASAIRSLQEQSVGRIRLKTRMLEEYSIKRLTKIVASFIVYYWSSERKLRVYDRSGQIQHVAYDPDIVRTLDYEVRVTPGSTAGIDKESIFSVMQELLTAGAIDTETFFTVTDVPYRTEILQKIQEQKELEQAALQEQAAMEEAAMLEQGIPQV